MFAVLPLFLISTSILLTEIPPAAAAPQAVYATSADVRIHSPTLVMLTHASVHFDPLRETEKAISETARKAKSVGVPIVCLHDRHNADNPLEKSFVPPTAGTILLDSDVGNFDIALAEVQHLVCMGGFFEQCERTTVCDAIRLWRRDRPLRDFRITQVTDGLYCVTQYVDLNDPYADSVRKYFFEQIRSRHRLGAVSVDRVLKLIDSDQSAATWLLRQAPDVPADVNIVADYFGQRIPVRFAGTNAVTLTLAFRRSDSADLFAPVQPAVSAVRR
ncbi:MAG: hypothetical protein KDA89_00990 [Planctomycetaceae bacterium]|nr:hypothetical protein [Planctomycetaceae bacterium]